MAKMVFGGSVLAAAVKDCGVEYSVFADVSGAKPPQRISFVETLTKILCDNLPDFWRLGQSYLSGKLLKEVCVS